MLTTIDDKEYLLKLGIFSRENDLFLYFRRLLDIILTSLWLVQLFMIICSYCMKRWFVTSGMQMNFYLWREMLYPHKNILTTSSWPDQFVLDILIINHHWRHQNKHCHVCQDTQLQRSLRDCHHPKNVFKLLHVVASFNIYLFIQFNKLVYHYHW